MGTAPHYLEFIRFALLLSKLHPNMFRLLLYPISDSNGDPIKDGS